MSDLSARPSLNTLGETTAQTFDRILATATAQALAELHPKRVGRPAIGSAPASVVAVRLDPELHRQLIHQMSVDGVSASTLVRNALKLYLAARAA